MSKYLWECCPCGLHSVISRLLAGGSLGFRIVPLLLHGSQITDSIFVVLLFRSCFPCHTNLWGDTMLSSLLVRFRCLWTDQLITGRAGFWCVFWVFLSVLVGFGFLLFAPLSYTVTAQWIMYWSYSVPFCMYIVVMTDVAIALIRWICKLQLSFRLDDLARAIWRWTEKKMWTRAKVKPKTETALRVTSDSFRNKVSCQQVCCTTASEEWKPLPLPSCKKCRRTLVYLKKGWRRDACKSWWQTPYRCTAVLSVSFDVKDCPRGGSLSRIRRPE